MKTKLLMVCVAIAMLFAAAGCDSEWQIGRAPPQIAVQKAFDAEDAARRAEDAAKRAEDAAQRAATETNHQDAQDSNDSAHL